MRSVVACVTSNQLRSNGNCTVTQNFADSVCLQIFWRDRVVQREIELVICTLRTLQCMCGRVIQCPEMEHSVIVYLLCALILYSEVKKMCCLLFAYLTRIVAVCKTEPYKSFRYNISSTYILYGDKPGVCIVFCFTHRFVSLWFVDC